MCFLIKLKVATSQMISNSLSIFCVRQSTWSISRNRNTRLSRKNTQVTRYLFLHALILNLYHSSALQQSTINLMNSRKKSTDAPNLPRSKQISADSLFTIFSVLYIVKVFLYPRHFHSTHSQQINWY